ncbi:HK97-gp10 family putative phage morphogenesis protein [Granulicella sp. 5B5]|uniref:HK97-gp10 family putative phage morphogenesis protein n=1 Tax=Granulicella sp. 5B5 TaxID=1617967 RepID=UPI0015F7413F|nr:HK97-gp10 family putative phage morphogenesis protein [Granulicella sp. 5B5]
MSITYDNSGLQKRLEKLRQTMVEDAAKKAVLAGAKVIAVAMAEAAPVLDKRTANSKALEPGSVKADIRARMDRDPDNEMTTAIAGPTRRTGYVCRFLEFGHRWLWKKRYGGRSGPDVEPHPFLRAAYESSINEAISARDNVLREELRNV